jgi:predicted nucleotidyltransferase
MRNRETKRRRDEGTERRRDGEAADAGEDGRGMIAARRRQPVPTEFQSMLTKADILARREEILAIARKHGASDVRIFGSIARGDASEQSDLDLLVKFEPDRSLMDYGMLIEDLRGLLGFNVDVVSEGALRPGDHFRDEVLREAVPL